MSAAGITFTLVSTADCHLCDHARGVLEHVRADHPLVVREVDWQSREGSALASQEGVPFPPAFYLDNSFLGYGRLSERKLRRRLAEATR